MRRRRSTDHRPSAAGGGSLTLQLLTQIFNTLLHEHDETFLKIILQYLPKHSLSRTVPGVGYSPYRFATGAAPVKERLPGSRVLPPGVNILKTPGRCIIPNNILEYALQERTDEERAAAIAAAPPPRNPRRFPPIHPQVLDRLLETDQLWPVEDVFTHRLTIQPDGTTLCTRHTCTDHVPIYSTPRVVDGIITKMIHIWDRRVANARDPMRGVKYSLYNFTKTLHFIQHTRYTDPTATVWFYKRDWRSYYPSLIKSLGVDTTCIKGTYYGTVRCVFGSHTEPAIAQTFNQALWSSSHSGTCSCTAIQIVDDTLAASTDLPHLTRHVDEFVSLGEAHGLVDASDKAEGPATVMPFGGKIVSNNGISHPIPNFLATLIYIVDLLTNSHTCQISTLKRHIMGTLNWVTAHTRLARPFMARLYQTRTIDVRNPFVAAALARVFAAAAPPAPAVRGIAPFLPLPSYCPVMYVDASFTDELGCIVFLSKEKCWMQRFLIPTKYTKNQQLAELYAALFALYTILRDDMTEILLVGDNNGVLGTLFSFRTPTKNFPKLHLNSRISRTVGRLRGFVHIRWCASGASWQTLDPEISVNRLGNAFPQHILTTTLIHGHWKSSHTPT